METNTTYNRYITIINSITNNIVYTIKYNDAFHCNLKLFLYSYKGPNEDYAKLTYNGKIINSINIFKTDDLNFDMSEDTDIIYMTKSYKKYVYLILNDNTYCTYNNMYNYDNYYHLIFCYITNNYNYIDDIQLTIPISCYKNIEEFSHKELITSIYSINKLKYIPTNILTDDMLDDHDFLLNIIISCPDIMININNKVKNNYDIISKIVKINGMILKYASIELKDNYDIVLAAITQHKYAINYASDRLKEIIKI